jgi:DNA damage-binding protein 1
VTQIPNDFYEFLLEVQESLINVIKPIGKIEHAYWRSFHNDRKQEPCEGFIDGDLIESFLDLPREQMKQVVSGLMVRFKLVCNLGITNSFVFRLTQAPA